MDNHLEEKGDAHKRPAQEPADGWKCTKCGAVSEAAGALSGDNFCLSCLAENVMKPMYAAECRDNTNGDAIRLVEVRAELAAAAEYARSAIADAKKGQPTESTMTGYGHDLGCAPVGGAS